jgi:CubicO group peptidase (beta-lactamase class C family)
MATEPLQAMASMVGGSGMVIREGYVIYTWGNPSTRVNWASASKPLTATLLWMAVNEGRCELDSAVGEFLSGGTVKDRTITLHQLANMTSGYSRLEWPATAWAYNDHAIQLFGHLLYDEILDTDPQTAITARLGSLDFQDPVVVSDSQKGRVVEMSIRDFGRIGHFWLNRGAWDGAQLLPDHYFDLITNQVPEGLLTTVGDFGESWSYGTFGGTDNQLDWGQGHYGYTFWVNTNGLWPGLWPEMYQANGHWGEEVCTVIPEIDLVVVSAGGDWGHPSTAPLGLIYDSMSILGVGDGDDPIETTISWTRIKEHYGDGVPRRPLRSDRSNR